MEHLWSPEQYLVNTDVVFKVEKTLRMTTKQSKRKKEINKQDQFGTSFKTVDRTVPGSFPDSAPHLKNKKAKNNGSLKKNVKMKM